MPELSALPPAWTVLVCPECGVQQTLSTCWVCRDENGSERRCDVVPVVRMREERMRADREVFLRGQYDALGWVLTSPRINGELRDRIRAKAMDIYDEVEGCGRETA